MRKQASTGVAWLVPIWDDGRLDSNVKQKEPAQNGGVYISNMLV